MRLALTIETYSRTRCRPRRLIFLLSPSRAVPADIVEHPTISYLPRQRTRRLYTTSAGWDYPGFYVGDVANFDDLVTYWSLRAADVPLSFVDPNYRDRFSDFIPAWEKLAEEFPARFPDGLKRIAVWARNEATLQLFERKQFMFCPIDDSFWHGGGVCAPMMYFGEVQVLAAVSQSGSQLRVSFPLAEKPFSDDLWFHTQRLVASVSFGGLHDDQFTLRPPYVPELNEFLSRKMHFQPRALRVEPERLGVIIDAADPDVSIAALSVSELFERVFDLAGFSTRLSNGGLIALQLITRLGGLQGARVFKIPGVRSLLRNGPNASFSKMSALELIGQKDPENPGARFDDHTQLFIEPRPINEPLEPLAVFSYLVDKGLFRIGADLTCPVCRLSIWVALDNLQQRVVCSLCGSEFDTSRQLIKDRWDYRRSGVLGLEKNNQGAAPVVLTLQQLDANYHYHMSERLYSPSLDLTPKDGTPPIEVDFVWMICREARHRNVVILGECKDRKDDVIDEKVIQNLRRVADALPSNRFETFILLAKLAPFTEQEINLAQTLNGEHRLRVIILTARELEPYLFLERTKNEYPELNQYVTSPEGLAQVTAQIYFSQHSHIERHIGPRSGASFEVH